MMLKSPILVPDESLAPCAWLLILADGEVSEAAIVDIDRLDDDVRSRLYTKANNAWHQTAVPTSSSKC